MTSVLPACSVSSLSPNLHLQLSEQVILVFVLCFCCFFFFVICQCAILLLASLHLQIFHSAYVSFSFYVQCTWNLYSPSKNELTHYFTPETNVHIPCYFKVQVDPHYLWIQYLQIYLLKFTCQNQYLWHFQGHLRTREEWQKIWVILWEHVPS